jgi:hypothetical protein
MSPFTIRCITNRHSRNMSIFCCNNNRLIKPWFSYSST